MAIITMDWGERSNKTFFFTIHLSAIDLSLLLIRQIIIKFKNKFKTWSLVAYIYNYKWMVAVTVSLRWFHSVTSDNFWQRMSCHIAQFCWVTGTGKPWVLFTTCFTNALFVSHSSNLLGWILCRSFFTGVRKSFGGMAGNTNSGILPSASL